MYTEVDEDLVTMSHNYINNQAVVFNDDRLSYIGQDCQRIPPMLAQLYGARVRNLDLSFNCLTALTGLERFPALHSVVLDNNLLPDSLHLPHMPHLHTLSLNKNKLCDLEALLHKISSNAPSLRHLSLLGNVACPNQLSDAEKDEEDYRRYRYYVLHHLPNLQFLDSTAVSETERQEALRRGKFMKVVKPARSALSDHYEAAAPDMSAPYSPLPVTHRTAGDHQGAYGRCRFRYSGKHSEGNRFIQNQDL